MELSNLVQKYAILPPNYRPCQGLWNIYCPMYHYQYNFSRCRPSRRGWQSQKCPINRKFRCVTVKPKHSDVLRYCGHIRGYLICQYLTIFFLVFTYIFAAEAFLKILALGFITYLQDPWNTFDFVIVIISISDVFISLTSSSDEAQNSGLNVLRTLRFMVKNVRPIAARFATQNWLIRDVT